MGQGPVAGSSSSSSRSVLDVVTGEGLDGFGQMAVRASFRHVPALRFDEGRFSVEDSPRDEASVFGAELACADSGDERLEESAESGGLDAYSNPRNRIICSQLHSR